MAGKARSKAHYIFTVSMDVDADKEAIFNEVYDTEHCPELLKVPGVLATQTLIAFQAFSRHDLEAMWDLGA